MSPSLRSSGSSCPGSPPALSSTDSSSDYTASLRTPSLRNIDDLLMPITPDPELEWTRFTFNRQRTALKRDLFNNRPVDWKSLPVIVDDSTYDWSELDATRRLRCDGSARYLAEILANTCNQSKTGGMPTKSNKHHSNFFAKAKWAQKSEVWGAVKHAIHDLPDRILHHKNSKEQCTITVRLDDSDEEVIDMIG